MPRPAPERDGRFAPRDRRRRRRRRASIAARIPAAQGAEPAAIRLPRIAPIAMPADAAACRRARIGRPSRRSIRAPSAFMVTSTTPPRNPATMRATATSPSLQALSNPHRAAPKTIARDRQNPLEAEAMRQRAARRHGDEIGAGIDGEQDPERRGVDARARQDRAGGAAPQSNAGAEGEEHRRDRGMQRSTASGAALRRDRAQKSVGAPPSALRRATKAASASRRSASSGGATKSRSRSATIRSAASRAVGEPASRQLS